MIFAAYNSILHHGFIFYKCYIKFNRCFSSFFTFLLTTILAIIYRKTFTVNLPLYEQHIVKRKKFIIFQWVMVTITAIGFLIGSLTEMKVLLFISLFAFLITIISAIFGRLAFAAKYKNEKL